MGSKMRCEEGDRGSLRNLCNIKETIFGKCYFLYPELYLYIFYKFSWMINPWYYGKTWTEEDPSLVYRIITMYIII